MMLYGLACLAYGLIQVAKYPEVLKHLIPTTPIIYYLYIRTGFRVGLCVSLYYWCRSIVFGHGPLRKKNIRISWIFVKNYIGPKLFWPSLFNPP
jgi:hypothetical protein